LNKDLRDFKKIIILTILFIVVFGLGWWTNDMSRFANGIIDDKVRIDSLKNIDSLLKGKFQGQLENKIYHSPDNLTGGFNTITFQLLKSGKFYIIDSVAVESNNLKESIEYTWTGDTILSGDWIDKNEKIYCIVNKSSIEKTLFKNTKSIIIKDIPTVFEFSNELDTIWIKGVPCIKF
jgi:hypothetical protein